MQKKKKRESEETTVMKRDMRMDGINVQDVRLVEMG